MRLVVVAGTGTEVGKTWVTCRLARALRETGAVVAARKLAQSFDPTDRGADGSTDADLLAAATGEEPTAVCPAHRRYPKAMAPPMAAESMGLAPFTLADLARELSWSPGADVGLLEQAGGLGAPQASDGDGADLVRLLAPDHVVLVAGAGLGTLSHIRLAVGALPGRPPVVYLNRFEPSHELHAANRRWLADRWGLDVASNPAELVEYLYPSPGPAR